MSKENIKYALHIINSNCNTTLYFLYFMVLNPIYHGIVVGLFNFIYLYDDMLLNPISHGIVVFNSIYFCVMLLNTIYHYILLYLITYNVRMLL